MNIAVSGFARMNGCPGRFDHLRHIAGIAVIATMALITLWCASSLAHEVQPALADVEAGGTSVTITLETGLEAHLAEIDITRFDDINNAPADQAAAHDRLRALEPEALAERFEVFWPQWRDTLHLTTEAGDRLELQLVAIEPGLIGDVEVQRSSALRLRADLPKGTQAVSFGWDSINGPLILREVGDVDDVYTGYLTNGQSGGPISVASPGGLTRPVFLGMAGALLLLASIIVVRRLRA